ncbi:MAG: histidine ammonia-lyase [Phycisphaerae bacterium]|nr:histidine ammonia-lyase [Phycisphaerae bacterium]
MPSPTISAAAVLEPLRLNGQPLTIADIESVARGGRQVELGPIARQRMEASRAVVDARCGGGEAIYGINTGFGSLSRVRIPTDDVRSVQRNLVRSHAAGVGEPLPNDAVRAMMTVAAASLARGHSGVRPTVVETICSFLNHQVTPTVPSRGSVGASGDLAPLAHMALSLIGEGFASLAGRMMPTSIYTTQRAMVPLTLEAKEGLALINGTHFMSSSAALLLADLDRIQQAALVAAAMAIDACRATDAFLDSRLHTVRCQPGQILVAERLRGLLAGSQILPAHKENDPRVQDPYCLRAMPQVLGAAFDAIAFVRGAIERELGAVTDNPLVFPPSEKATDGSGDLLSGGNFHGMPLAIPLDTLAIALTHIAGIAERRVNWVLTASDPQNPVPAYLSPQPGLHSGLMIAQYTAAACVNEMMTLAAPASIGNIPTSAGIEDYNSMGATAVLKAIRSLERLRNVVAIELLTMTEAMEYQRPLKSGAGVERAIAIVREVVPKLTADRPPSPDIAAIERQIAAGRFGMA